VGLGAWLGEGLGDGWSSSPGKAIGVVVRRAWSAGTGVGALKVAGVGRAILLPSILSMTAAAAAFLEAISSRSAIGAGALTGLADPVLAAVNAMASLTWNSSG
jgi:uncharacterized membrane protein (DUF441 family)